MKKTNFIALILLMCTQTHSAHGPKPFPTIQENPHSILSHKKPLLTGSQLETSMPFTLPYLESQECPTALTSMSDESASANNHVAVPETLTNEQNKLIKAFYTHVFFQPSQSTSNHQAQPKNLENLQKTLAIASAHELLMKKHFSLYTFPNTDRALMRCTIPEPAAPGGKMIVCGQLWIKPSDKLFKEIQPCCSHLTEQP